ncbi:MAG: AAA family ATPase [Firmicutes bacterium]|nr:AAA family ATPase [Bacillota bacterium]
MSKVNQIQNGLKGLGDAAFQKLADAYLYKKGYGLVNPLGAVAGADKTRDGTPDTYVPLPNGKYVFAEYTTQQSQLFPKLLNDLRKCFDEARTGIAVKKVQEVVFCHTSVLKPGEEDVLRQECQKHGVNLSIFGIGPISHDLYEKYPEIAKDFLGIEVDTGQVISPEVFVAAYNRQLMAAPLNTPFHFREEELKHALRALEEREMVLVSGRPGVGKSRLALEVCHRFEAEHPEYKVRCIFNRYVDLFQDLRVHFSEPGHYLIFADDANRVNRFEYVLQLLHDRGEGRVVKIIATVRDYAVDRVWEMARPYGKPISVEVPPLKDEQIKEIIMKEYGISNLLYLDRIADISGGNPRLAIMAAQVANRENTLRSIVNVSALYDEYYRSVRQDLTDLDDKNLLRVAGIVVFFGAVDRTDEKRTKSIEAVFGVPTEAFWGLARRLHDLEILDMYESEVVRVSDQILATYLFNLCFFRDKVLDFSMLLAHFFPTLRDQLVHALYPVLDAFLSEQLMEQLRSQVGDFWQELKDREDMKGLLSLMDVFWFVKSTETLAWIKDYVSKLESVPSCPPGLEMKADPCVPSPSVLSILSHFWNSPDDAEVKIAVELVLDYLAKRPNEVQRVLHVLAIDFGFRHTSFMRRFYMQETVVRVLWERTKDGTDDRFLKVFIAVAQQYLQTQFESLESKRDNAVRIIRFPLSLTPDVRRLRALLWNRLFRLWRTPSARGTVLDFLLNYEKSLHESEALGVITHDAQEVIRFIEENLDPNVYRHCVVAQGFLHLLDRMGIPFDAGLRYRFRNAVYNLAEILTQDEFVMMRSGIDYEECQRLRRSQIEQCFANYGLTEYRQFFKHCLEILKWLDQGTEEYRFRYWVTEVLLVLSERKPALYVEVLDDYLSLGEPLAIDPTLPVSRLVEVSGACQAFVILSRCCHRYTSRRRWLFALCISVPIGDITVRHLRLLYSLYRRSRREEMPQRMDFLTKYQNLDPKVVLKVTEIVLAKTAKDSKNAFALCSLFNPHTEIGKSLVEVFGGNPALLKRCYLAVQAVDEHSDYNGEVFAKILDMDRTFIVDYIDWMYGRKEHLGRYDDPRDYTFIWEREDFQELVERAVERIYANERNRRCLWSAYLVTFFRTREDKPPDAKVQERQDWCLSRLIESRSGDADFMQFVFSLIAEFPAERRLQFLVLFLERNKDFEVFRRLPLEPSLWTWRGSEIPVLKGRVEYYEAILPHLNTIELLTHRAHVQHYVEALRRRIECEEKRDFVEGRPT